MRVGLWHNWRESKALQSEALSVGVALGPRLTGDQPGNGVWPGSTVFEFLEGFHLKGGEQPRQLSVLQEKLGAAGTVGSRPLRLGKGLVEEQSSRCQQSGQRSTQWPMEVSKDQNGTTAGIAQGKVRAGLQVDSKARNVLAQGSGIVGQFG